MMNVFERDTEECCGETCDRQARIELDGLVFCEDCLSRLVVLGRVFIDALDEAKRRYGPGCGAEPTRPGDCS